MASMRHENLSRLQGRVGSVRHVEGGAEMPATLADVGERLERQGFEQFSLLFQVQQAGEPRQGLHAVVIEGEPVGEMFLVPVARNGDQVSYEACFNRRVAGAEGK